MRDAKGRTIGVSIAGSLIFELLLLQELATHEVTSRTESRII
jgi:hypothetical protein